MGAKLPSHLHHFWEEPDRYMLVVSDHQPPGVPQEIAQLGMIVTASRLAPMTVECSESDAIALQRRMRDAGVRVVPVGMFRERLSAVHGTSESPVQVCASELSSAHHVRLSDGRFQLVVGGRALPIHAGFEHILAIEALAEAIAEHAGNDVTLVDAVVYDPASRADTRAYREILPRHELTPQAVFEDSYVRARAWHFRREALFLSRPVCAALKDFPGVSYHPGFSYYRGCY